MMTSRCLPDRLVTPTAALLLVLLPAAVRAQAAPQPEPTIVTLEQALQYAIDHYPSVRAAVDQVQASAAGVDVARAGYLPRFDAMWQTSRATANNIVGQVLPQSIIPALTGPVLPSASGRGVWGSATGGLFSWEPVDFGLRAAVVREAEAGVARAQADERLARLAVQSTVGMAFLGVLSAQQAVTAADADVQRRDVLARAARTLADNQLRPGAEASRADAELAAARTRVIQVRQTLAVAEATLAQLLGVTSGPVGANAARLLDSGARDRVVPAPPSEHPLLRSGQAAIDVARAREDVLARTDRPRVYLQSSVFARGSGADADGSFDGGADGLGLERVNWAAGVQVVFPNLFDFASLRARRTAAGAQTRAQTAHYDETRLTIAAQRSVADAMIDAARAIARNTPVQLAAARQSEAQARARYDAGLTGLVEVAEAQSLLAGAEFQNAVALVDVWRALLAQAAASGDMSAFIEAVRAGGVP
jgi:outer membrane protein TolC